jgi:hypothetical protein
MVMGLRIPEGTKGEVRFLAALVRNACACGFEGNTDRATVWVHGASYEAPPCLAWMAYATLPNPRLAAGRASNIRAHHGSSEFAPVPPLRHKLTARVE